MHYSMGRVASLIAESLADSSVDAVVPTRNENDDSPSAAVQQHGDGV